MFYLKTNNLKGVILKELIMKNLVIKDIFYSLMGSGQVINMPKIDEKILETICDLGEKLKEELTPK